MEKQFQLIGIAQQNFIQLMEGLSMEQLNKIPGGYKNNLVWNFAHTLSALQMLCYGRPGLALRLDEIFVHKYNVGTKPETPVTGEEFNKIKQFAQKGLQQLEEDYRQNHFENFTPYSTSSGIAVADIDFAINYVILRHGMHHGYAMAIKKLVV